MSKFVEEKRKNSTRTNKDAYADTTEIFKVAISYDNANKLEELNKIEFKSNSDFYDFVYSKLGLPVKAREVKPDTTATIEQPNAMISFYIDLYKKQILANKITDLKVIQDSINKNVEDKTARQPIYTAVTKHLNKSKVNLFE